MLTNILINPPIPPDPSAVTRSACELRPAVGRTHPVSFAFPERRRRNVARMCAEFGSRGRSVRPSRRLGRARARGAALLLRGSRAARAPVSRRFGVARAQLARRTPPRRRRVRLRSLCRAACHLPTAAAAAGAPLSSGARVAAPPARDSTAWGMAKKRRQRAAAVAPSRFAGPRRLALGDPRLGGCAGAGDAALCCEKRRVCVSSNWGGREGVRYARRHTFAERRQKTVASILLRSLCGCTCTPPPLSPMLNPIPLSSSPSPWSTAVRRRPPSSPFVARRRLLSSYIVRRTSYVVGRRTSHIVRRRSSVVRRRSSHVAHRTSSVVFRPSSFVRSPP